MTKKTSVMLIVVLVLAGGVAAFFTLKLDKPIFEAKVKQGIEAMQARAQAQGRNLQVSYENFDVRGSWFKREAVLSNVTVKAGSPGGREIEFFIPQALYIPESITLTSYRVEIPGGIKTKENGVPMGSLTYDTPVVFTSTAKKGEVLVAFDVPLQMAFTSEATPSQPVQLSFGSKPIIMQRNDVFGMPLESHVVLENIKTSGPQGEMSVARFTVDMTNIKIENGPKHDVSYAINVKDVALPVGVNPYGAFTFVLNANYIGALPKDMQFSTLGTFQPEEFQVKLNELSLAAKNFAVSLKADVTVTKADPMPVGTGLLRIENLEFVLQEMMNAQAITAEDIAKIDPIILKITGKTLSESKDLEIAFERKAGDVLHVGAATGDEVLMMAMPLFTGAPPMPVAQDAPATTTPPAPKMPALAAPVPTPPTAAPVTPVIPAPVAPVVPPTGTAAAPVLMPPTTTAKEAAPAAAAPSVPAVPVAPAQPPAAPPAAQ